MPLDLSIKSQSIFHFRCYVKPIATVCRALFSHAHPITSLIYNFTCRCPQNSWMDGYVWMNPESWLHGYVSLLAHDNALFGSIASIHGQHRHESATSSPVGGSWCWFDCLCSDTRQRKYVIRARVAIRWVVYIFSQSSICYCAKFQIHFTSVLAR